MAVAIRSIFRYKAAFSNPKSTKDFSKARGFAFPPDATLMRCFKTHAVHHGEGSAINAKLI
jgi:hypothetical protein